MHQARVGCLPESRSVERLSEAVNDILNSGVCQQLIAAASNAEQRANVYLTKTPQQPFALKRPWASGFPWRRVRGAFTALFSRWCHSGSAGDQLKKTRLTWRCMSHRPTGLIPSDAADPSSRERCHFQANKWAG